MTRWAVVFAILAALAGGLCWYALGPGAASDERPRLTVFCAAGVKGPVTAIAEEYRREFGVEVQLQFGGTGTLMAQLAIARQGDLFIAADADSVATVRERGLVREVIPLAQQYPVVAVRAGNPRGITSLDDLFRTDVRVAVGNPEATSIGKSTRSAFGDRWAEFVDRVTVMKPTVNEIALDLKVGGVDAAIVWNSTVPQFEGLEAVRLSEFDPYVEEVGVAVLASSEQPAAALRFARYLAAPEKGAATLKQQGFEAVPGDTWAATPEFLLYSGGVNRPALAPLLEEFADREGVEFAVVFNGCGILCASMQALQEQENARLPDAYYACDLCFVAPVADTFPETVLLTETDIGIAVPRGNPHGIESLGDLAKRDLRVGICNARQSTLGHMTAAMLRETNLAKAVRENVVVEVPTADFLVNQMRAGALDAAIVYRVNARLQREHLDFVPIAHEGARAVQPFSIRGDSPRRQLAGRLLAFLREHRDAFEASGFVWRGDAAALQSNEIAVPPWLRRPGDRPFSNGDSRTDDPDARTATEDRE